MNIQNGGRFDFKNFYDKNSQKNDLCLLFYDANTCLRTQVGLELTKMCWALFASRGRIGFGLRIVSTSTLLM